MVESLALLKVVGKEFGRGKNIFLILGELALVEVAIQFKQLLNCKTTGLLVIVFCIHYLLTVVPPVNDGLAMFCSHRFCLGEMLVAFWHIKTVEPRFFCAEPFICSFCTLIVEEEDIRCYSGVERKDAARQTDNGMQIELSEQFLFDGKFCIVSTKQKTVRKDYSGTTVLCKAVHDEHHEQVGSLT